MAEPMLTDIRALMVEREDCDAGTVKKWHLKLGIALFFSGHTRDAVEHLKQGDTALASFYLGRALLSLQELEDAQKAFEKAEKAGYNASQVHLQLAAIARHRGERSQARSTLHKLEKDLASHSAEFHYQVACGLQAEGDQAAAIEAFERAEDLDPSHAGVLFQLAHANDLAGNDLEAMSLYERCLKHPPIHVGALMNLGVLYEDDAKFDKAVECYSRVLGADPTNEHARLFLKDAQASLSMYYSPEDERAMSPFSQGMEIPVTHFELCVRSRNWPKKKNIRTVGHLTRVPEAALLSSKNFGETSLSEIKEMMTTKGLHLGQSLEEGAHHEFRFRPQQPLSEEEQAVLSKPVSELNLSVRARKR